jgi:membrane protease YdiL (CAAX protease family)
MNKGKLEVLILRYLLKKETAFVGKVLNIFTGFSLMLWLQFSFILLFAKIYRMQEIDYGIFFQVNSYQLLSWYEKFLKSCIFAPIWEELLFRYAPIEIARRAGEKKYLLPVIATSSIIFGLAHYGVVSIFIQGIGGLIMSILYVKNGYSLTSSFVLHFLWNLFILLGEFYFK